MKRGGLQRVAFLTESENVRKRPDFGRFLTPIQSEPL